MIYVFKCIICCKEFDIVQQMNDIHKAFHCGIEAQRIWNVPHTKKDLLYNFTTNTFGDRVQIHSKRQYQKLLKENKMVDITRNELKTIKPKDNAEKSRRETVKKVAQQLQSEGLARHFPNYVRDFYGR